MTTGAMPSLIAQTVSSRRSEAGMTQDELAHKAGISLRLVSDLEAGRAENIGLSRLLAILGCLGISLSLTFAPAQAVEGHEPYYEQHLAEEYLESLIESRSHAS